MAREPHVCERCVHHYCAAKLKQIWLQPDKKSAIRVANMLMDEYASSFPKAWEC